MSLLNGLFRLYKKLVIFILIMAIALPLRYGSTDYQHLRIRLLHSLLSLKYSLVPDHARPTLTADYRAFESIVRMGPLFNSHSSNDSVALIKNLRLSFNNNSLVPTPSQCQINKEVFEYDGHSVDAYWIDNHQNKFQRNSDKILLYFHGGGYILGDIHGYSGYECHLSQLFNVTILHLEYRLCPEHRLPAPVEDSVALYRALLHENILPSQLMIMGDSAGGGLSLLTIQALIARKLPVPRGVITLSPWTDLSTDSESHTRNLYTDVMLRYENNDWSMEQLLGPNHSQSSLHSSVFSPLFGSFEGFPPMYINVGTAEILEDDSRSLYKKAQEASVDVTFEEGLHLMHVYPMFFPYFTEARNTLDNINKWIRTINNRKLNE